MVDETPITFVVAGQRRDLTRGGAAVRSAAALPGRLKDSLQITARRGAETATRITAVPGEDVVVLHLSNGPALVLHPQIARELLLAQADGSSAARSRGPALHETEVEVPAQLSWRDPARDAAVRGTTRGLLGDVLLTGIDIVTDLFKGKASDFLAEEVVARVDAGVEAGVYQLSAASLRALKGSGHRLAQIRAADAPSLVLIHGTFSDTVGTFGDLWRLHGTRVKQLFGHYGDRVYALDHPTLGASPIQNALTLVEACPVGARLHLLTHSRGGLVAETLARVCANPQLSAADLELFDEAVYATQRDELQKLAHLVAAKQLKVERLMRVACPARGSLLAGKRLDAYISVLKWALELAGAPVAAGLVDFLGQVALNRTKPDVIPGLAAMLPDSPLVQWLHAVDEPIPGELRVMSGDVRGSSLAGWIKILISDWFYWTDNDLIVHTRAMYGGAPRAQGASFVLEAGGDVSHFNYFKHERSVQAIIDGLTQQVPSGYRPIGPLSWAGEDAGGVRAARAAKAAGKPVGDMPAVVVLPGILGSHLKVDEKRIWLSLRIVGGLRRLAYKPGDHVAPDGPIGSIYDDLIDYLAASHEVIPFGYDWRRPLQDEARKLAKTVDAALAARSLSGQPVRILAHSMGGLLARTFWLNHPGVWKQMIDRPGARFLMLGTPNDGSWAPMQVLSGDDSFGNALTGFGAPFHEADARELMAAMPGFLQLQAGLLDASLGLDKSATWQKLAADDLEYLRAKMRWHGSEQQINAQRWGVPLQPVLDQARELREKLNAQIRDDLPRVADKVLLVVGSAKRTPAGFSLAPNGFEYLDEVDGGDGRVTLASARLPAVRTWTLDCVHGELPRVHRAFDAFAELLERGETDRLHRQTLPAASRGAGAAAVATQLLRSRPARARLLPPPPPDQPSAAFEPPQETPSAAGEGPRHALRVTVLNGDVTLVREPLLVGHYQSFALTGAEAVVNKLSGGAMQQSLRVGQYPDLPGSHQIFLNPTTDPENPWRAPCPEAVIVVGLGEESTLTPAELARTVRQGVIAWSQRQVEGASGAPVELSLAATLVGSGGTGISAGAAARAVAQGVRDANRQLALIEWPIVSHLILTELFHDRATAAWQGLSLLANGEVGELVLTPEIKLGTGPLPRPLDADYRGVDNDLITVTSDEANPADAKIRYTIDTRRARSEVSAQATQLNLIRRLVKRASNDGNRDERIGRTLFQLLVPEKLEPFLSSREKMVLELDAGTAGIPWELLDVSRDPAAQEEPWAIRSRLLRKLRTTHYRHSVRDAQPDDHVLVVGEPRCDPTLYPRLPGAAEEAREVETRLRGPGGVLDPQERVHALFDADAETIINTLFERRYRVVHIAGHGELGAKAGVVLSDESFLSAREIEQMRTVPELVFVNCCHLAARDEKDLLTPRVFDRVQFAANVADALIKIGVRCVVAAGWAVEDGPAKLFATTFYRELLADRPFVDAVYEARKAAWNLGRSGNTWAAYQCYGDPDWTYRLSDGVKQAKRSIQDDYARIASADALRLALKTLEVETVFQGRERNAQLERLRYLDARFAKPWGESGDVAEAFARAYAALGGLGIPQAIAWYERAVQAEDASASRRAEEQLYNLRVRHAEARIGELGNVGDAVARAEASTSARAALRDAAHQLEQLARAQPTLERLNLCGSAYKRIFMACNERDDEVERATALEQMRAKYTEAQEVAFRRGSQDAFYPALNCLAVDLVARAPDAAWPAFNPASVEQVRQNLSAKLAAAPDFWSKVGAVELQLYERLDRLAPAAELAELGPEYEDLHLRVAALWMWRSVYDQVRFLLAGLVRSNKLDQAQLRALKALCQQLAVYAGVEG